MIPPVIIPSRLPRIIPSDRAWFDPPLLVANTEMITQDIVVPMGGAPSVVAPPNIRRLMIGFTQKQPSGTMSYSPWPDADTYQFSTQAFGTGTQWLTLFGYGLLVCSVWYAFTSGSQTIRVTQILRKG